LIHSLERVEVLAAAQGRAAPDLYFAAGPCRLEEAHIQPPEELAARDNAPTLLLCVSNLANLQNLDVAEYGYDTQYLQPFDG
jgi:hypothetical protein